MVALKWFDKVLAAQQDYASRPPGPLRQFDFEVLGTPGRIGQALARFAFRYLLPAIFFLLRNLWPNARLGRLVIVTRYSDVREVLANGDRAFPVVYAPEMTDLGGGTNGVLGLDGAEHRVLREQIMGAFRPADLDDIRGWTGRSARALVDAAGGRIDVVGDLVTRSATEACCRYLGLTAHDPTAFAQWSMAVSAQLFGNPLGDPAVGEQARIGAAHLHALIDDAMQRVVNNNDRYGPRARPNATLIDRLLTQQGMRPSLVRATVTGLATAFVPTNTLAAGNILEDLMASPARFGQSQRAALKLEEARRQGDEAAEATHLRELEGLLVAAAARSPALSPGIWRHAPEGGQIAAGSRRARTLRRGDILLLAIPSALRDGRMPADDRANPRRAADLMFGHGPHHCLGAEIALIQLTEVFAVLLALPGLAPVRGKAGRMVRTGPFPVRMDMSWDAPLARRAHVLASLPVRDGCPLDAVRAEAALVGNPVNPALRERFDATGAILFTSLTVVEAAPNASDAIIVIEINADGTRESAIRAYAEAAFADLAGVLGHCTPDGNPPADATAMAALIGRAAFDLDFKPWGNTGLHFDGLPELSVADIDRQARLADYARRALDYHAQGDFSRSSRAMDALLRVRRMIRQDSFYALRGTGDSVWGRLFRDGSAFQDAIVRPSGRRLGIADWTAPRSLFAPVGSMLLSPDGRPILWTMLVAWMAAGLSLGWWLMPGREGTIFDWVWTVLIAIAGGAAAALAAATLLAGAAIWLLRRHESRDHSDTDIADIDHVRAIAAREDAAGYAQNHIVALMPFKPGWFRKLSFAFTMWGIKQAVSFWFRPGFVVTMGTIHKARWFRLPGTNQFLFLSNYDGSWESYLEDFITRAHEGQSAAWSHGIGFPPTRFLILDGAQNGDRFKRWVRRQQRLTPIWYSRFPGLTAKQIRANAMIEDGLARAASDTDARRWLAHFGSSQREPSELESHEAQTILFSGFGKQEQATALALRLPGDRDACRTWLEAISGLEFQSQDLFKSMALPDVVASRKVGPRKLAMLMPEAALRFGDIPVAGGGCALGFTEAGLLRAGLDVASGIDQFPAAFRMAMAGRTGLLGDSIDPDDDVAARWRFSDRQDGANGVDALLMIYGAPEGGSHREQAAWHHAFLEALGGAVLHAVPCQPVVDERGCPRRDIEHFGWRDGISQPVIAGTRRSQRRVPPRDEVPPGEFILGYPNGQGFIAPPITVGAQLDPANILPTIAAGTTNRYPFFGNRSGNPDLRDLGRNGSFLTVRQLDQDVDGFREELRRAASELDADYRGLGAVQGTAIDDRWLGAKIIGRWQDGSPLIGNPTAPAGLAVDDVPDNDFSYGIDDPRGLACPLGSHIRRTNPRDSQEPGDLDEQQITNRHRLLRRGRSYAYRPDGTGQPVKGLLFMALCTDIERQFEFVQHTWINASSFHGLTQEADPLLGNPLAEDGKFLPHKASPPQATETPTLFSIPTEIGTIRVKGLQSHVSMQGGGYFFVPSRAAIMFLIHRLKHRALESARSSIDRVS